MTFLCFCLFYFGKIPYEDLAHCVCLFTMMVPLCLVQSCITACHVCFLLRNKTAKTKRAFVRNADCVGWLVVLKTSAHFKLLHFKYFYSRHRLFNKSSSRAVYLDLRWLNCCISLNIYLFF